MWAELQLSKSQADRLKENVKRIKKREQRDWGIVCSVRYLELVHRHPENQAIAITEIVPTESLDYEAKYDGKSKKYTCKDLKNGCIDPHISFAPMMPSAKIVRMDFIIDADKGPVLIEVNSIPGLSPASIVPQQVAYRGWKLSEVLSRLAEEQIA